MRCRSRSHSFRFHTEIHVVYKNKIPPPSARLAETVLAAMIRIEHPILSKNRVVYIQSVYSLLLNFYIPFHVWYSVRKKKRIALNSRMNLSLVVITQNLVGILTTIGPWCCGFVELCRHRIGIITEIDRLDGVQL